MADSCAVTWALGLRITIRLSASEKALPNPQPSTTAHSQRPERGAKISASSDTDTTTAKPDANARWSLQRAAIDGVIRLVTSCVRMAVATT